jgi:hypothetical protein
MSDGARYAVNAMLDSLNDTGISAENDQYRGAFAVFACFDIILHSKRWQNADGSNFTKIGIGPRAAGEKA